MWRVSRFLSIPFIVLPIPFTTAFFDSLSTSSAFMHAALCSYFDLLSTTQLLSLRTVITARPISIRRVLFFQLDMDGRALRRAVRAERIRRLDRGATRSGLGSNILNYLRSWMGKPCFNITVLPSSCFSSLFGLLGWRLGGSSLPLAYSTPHAMTSSLIPFDPPIHPYSPLHSTVVLGVFQCIILLIAHIWHRYSVPPSPIALSFLPPHPHLCLHFSHSFVSQLSLALHRLPRQGHF